VNGFRVPLQSEKKARLWALDTFHDVILAPRRRANSFAELQHALMMRAIGFDALFLQDAIKEGIGADADFMRQVIGRNFQVVSNARLWDFLLDILYERASASDVEHLATAADAEDGDVFCDGGNGEGVVEILPLRRHCSHQRVFFFHSIKRGVNIRSADEH